MPSPFVKPEPVDSGTDNPADAGTIDEGGTTAEADPSADSKPEVGGGQPEPPQEQ